MKIQPPEPKHVGWLIVFFLVVLIITQSGCASDRYFTKEQDDEAKATCEPAGCVVVPLPIWAQILQRLQGSRI